MRYPLLVSTLTLLAAAFSVLFSIWRSARADSPAEEKPAKIETLPASRGGQDLVGTKFPTLHFDRWLKTPDNRSVETAGSVTLYRWWTDTCPFCAATLP